jgi:hypothetical protein
MKKILLTALTLGLLAAGTTVVFAAASGDSTTTAPTGTSTTRTTEDISGPCDEAEHANDPRCAGAARGREDDRGAGDRGRHGGGADDPAGHDRFDDHGNDDAVAEPGEDISGTCDEAEHASDPRCTGAAVGVVDEAVEDNSGPSMNSGPGSVSSGHDEIGDDSGSGSNSGPGGGDDSGSDESGSGSSGHGGGDD